MADSPAYAVDPDDLAALARVLDGAGRSMHASRAALARVQAGAAQWAVDGNLPGGLYRLLESLTWAVEDARSRSGQLARQVAAAAEGYRAAEASATAPPSGGIHDGRWDAI